LGDAEGYKAYRRSKIIDIIDRVRSRSHLFESELIILSQKKGLSFYEEPVTIEEIRKRGYITDVRKFVRVVSRTLIALLKFKLYGY